MMNAALYANPYQEFYALPLTEPLSSTHASFTLDITGKATKTGTIVIDIAGIKISVVIDDKATASAVATSIKAAIDDNGALPIGATSIEDTTDANQASPTDTTDTKKASPTDANKASSDDTISKTSSSLTLLAAFKGFIGNDIKLKILPNAIGITITSKKTDGTGAPAVADIIDNLGDSWWTEIINPFADDKIREGLRDEAVRRNGGTIQKPFITFGTFAGTKKEAQDFGATRNSPFETFLSFKSSEKPAFVIAAIYGALVAREAGNAPARPIQYLRLPRAGVIENHSDADRNQLIDAGLASLRIAADGQAQIEYAVTTYKTNDAGVADKSYREVEDINTLIYLRYSMANRLLAYYVRHRIGSDADNPVDGVVRPVDIKATLIGLATEWLNSGLITNIAHFTEGLSIERDKAQTGRVNIILSPNLIGQLRQFFTVIQFRN